MEQTIMNIMAMGVLIGGVDRICGNKKGYGQSMEEGFQLMGPTALSMVGIMYFIPFFVKILGKTIVPIYTLLGVDPAMAAGVLPIDMGGYQLAKELAVNPVVGAYAGIVVAATFGCTFLFTIPVGMGAVEIEDRPFFAKGIMIGLAVMPLGLLVGGGVCGMQIGEAMWNNIPIFALAIPLMIGLHKIPRTVMKLFLYFAVFLKIIITIGLVCGAITYMTGIPIFKESYPIEEALAVVASIGIVMLGSLPMALLLQRVLKTPFQWIGEKLGINETSVVGILIGTVSVLPQIMLLKNMDQNGKVINVAYIVSAASLFAVHIGFTASVEPKLLGALIASKLVGGCLAVIAALFMQKREERLSRWKERIHGNFIRKNK